MLPFRLPLTACVGIFYRHGVFHLCLSRFPFVGALGADEQALILIDKLGLATGQGVLDIVMASIV